ncbi:MAG: hypothetical protein AB1649_14460 [Chloroflexota bacterium]
MNIKLVLLNVSLLIILSSCTSLQNEAAFPDVGLPMEDLNQQIITYAPKGWNQFSTKDSIVLEVVANQDQTVLFRPIDVRIFRYESGDWDEIENKLSESDPDFEYVLDPNKSQDPSYRGTAMLLPDLSDTTVPVDLRIYVFGFIIENGEATDKRVGAFVDVHLAP